MSRILIMIIGYLSLHLAHCKETTSDETLKNRESILKKFHPDYRNQWIFAPADDDFPQKPELHENETIGISLRGGADTITFRLYTRNNSESFKLLQLPIDGKNLSKYPVNEPMFDVKKNIKILIHGWYGSGLDLRMIRLKDAYLIRENCCVVVVDWREMAWKIYFESVIHTKVVGRAVANLVNHLMSRYRTKPEQFHLVGFSLGAHVIGFAGKNSAQKLRRITGLDPASPSFEENTNYDARLHSTDAQFVDVIHTSGGLWGFKKPIGHADFYPNGGKVPQPGCVMDLIGICSHYRALDLFIESILQPKSFPTVRQDGASISKQHKDIIQYMGEDANPNIHGIFTLQTGGERPYAKKQ